MMTCLEAGPGSRGDPGGPRGQDWPGLPPAPDSLVGFSEIREIPEVWRFSAKLEVWGEVFWYSKKSFWN